MPPDVAFDNDVLIKLARWGLLGDVGTMLSGFTLGVLGTAKWVCPNHIPSSGQAHLDFQAMLAQAVPLEPDNAELQLSTSIVDAAALRNLPIDGGEALLMAVVAGRAVPYLVTGDKRAVSAAEALRNDMEVLGVLDGRFVCLEQLALALQQSLGDAGLREKVCADAGADRSMAICLGCAAGNEDAESHTEGMLSYIEDLRSHAPRLLSPAGLGYLKNTA